MAAVTAGRKATPFADAASGRTSVERDTHLAGTGCTDVSQR